MKILTKEEEEAHYKSMFRPMFHSHELIRSSATLKGGIGGGIAGLGLGALGVWGATVRYPAFRALTVPLRAFLITSSGTFAGMLQTWTSTLLLWLQHETLRESNESLYESGETTLRTINTGKSSAHPFLAQTVPTS